MAITLLFSEQALAGDWEKLGGRSSNLHGDYDVIHVNDLRRYDYIKLKVRKAGVTFVT